MGERLPRVSGKDVLAALRRNGWVEARAARGAHFYLHHPDRGGLVTVSVHGTDILKPKTLQTLLTQADLTADQLKEMQ